MHVLFVSPHCALDRNSGAAISVTTQLEELAKLDWKCRTLTGTVTSGQEPIDRHFAAWGVRRAGHAAQSLLLGTNRGGVEHLIVPMCDGRRSHITCGDEQRFFGVVREQLRRNRPDLLYIYGKRLLEQAIMREARRQGVVTAFYLANGSYREPEPFDDADAIFTPSQTLARFYGDSLKLTANSIGSFTRPLAVPPESTKDPDAPVLREFLPGGQAVLFVNPEPGKGASFLIEIARRCLTELPEARFLVVESRGTKASAASQFQIDWAELPNVAFRPQQADLGLAFAAARLLLFPSLSFEGAPRIIVEANHARIPVLSSAHGGSPEMMDGAGFLIEVPPVYQSAFTTLPDSDAVKPWVEHLKLLFRDREVYDFACARAGEAAKRHDLPRLAETFSRRLLALTGHECQVARPHDAVPSSKEIKIAEKACA
jgi:glycosyltransferase involved in cell wall biosynthesis